MCGVGERTGVAGEDGALHEVIVAASSLLDPSALARVAVAEVRRVLGVEGASVAFWDEEERLLVPLAIDDPHVPEPKPVFRSGQGLIGEAFRRNAAVVVSDYAAELEHPAAWAKVVSGLGVPLHAEGRLVGAISGQEYQPREFTAKDVELIELIAAQVGPALGTMRTLARAQRQMAEAMALATLLRRGAEADNEEEIFELVSTTAICLLGADLAGLVLHTVHKGSAWCGVVGNRTEEWRGRYYGAEHPASATIFGGTTRIVRGPNGGIYDPKEFPFFAAEEICLGVSMPLNRGAGNASRGALCLGWRLDVELTPAHIDLCEALAAFSGSMVMAAATRAERDVVVANAPVLLMALDGEGIVTMCDGAAAAALGLGAEQVGRSLAELLPDEPALLEAVGAASPEQGPAQFEVAVRDRVLDVVVEVRGGGTFLIGTDVTDRCAAQGELRRRATEDELTGLPNKAEIVRRMAEVLAHEPICVAVADVRNFDHVNEAVGYEAADDLLRLLGSRLAQDIGDAIVVGRVGGDEFAVATGAQSLQQLGKRVRESLEAFMAGGAASTLSVDVRCGLASSAAGGDAQTLLRQADSALQIARRGTEAMVEWNAEIAAAHRPQMAVAQQLRRALEERSFTLVYQPVIDLRTGAVRRVEALARWPKALEPIVTPDVFVPLAERLGRIVQLTTHVLDLALAEVAAGLDVPVSVNISPHDVVNGDLPRLVLERLGAYNLAPSVLMLELTEHAALEAKTDVLRTLADAGVAISVDDFGRGWSSLETLKLLPARDLKLDRSYVERVSQDHTDAALVRAAVEVGHALAMEVVAEGIEDEVVLESVRELGCDLAQGYHLARPMDADALRVWLAEHRAGSGSRAGSRAVDS
jgi:diguanylate cyclase (GGDEF)-like protein